ncbi:Acg family FMN-binding oxidoreductase [Desulfosporosinus fructosivorans]|nr:twin-arginine translocation signal domain-containing protein [Desulfosporosinus fructosivorans]
MEDRVLFSRRNFIKGSAILGSLAVVGGFWRGLDSGVFSTSKGPAYAAWENSFEGVEGLVDAAILAANAHNAQPWLFKLGDSSIDIKADTDRNLGAVDPYSREMYISLGCALENLTIAAKAKGFSPKITYFPNKQDSWHIATIDLATMAPLPSALYDAIPKRHMNRGPYDKTRPISPEIIQTLSYLNTDSSDVKLSFFNTQQDKLKIGQAMIEATQALISDKEQINVDSKWMRKSWQDIQKYKDGITTDAQGLPTLTRIIAKMLPPMSQEQNNEFWLNTLKDKHVGTAAAFGFIAVPDLTNDLQVVKAGQLWERLHLWATSKGLGMQIMNQLSERRDRELSLNLTPQFGDKLREILKTSEWHSIIQFRMGYPTIEALPSPRRPVKDVIDSSI